MMYGSENRFLRIKTQRALLCITPMENTRSQPLLPNEGTTVNDFNRVPYRRDTVKYAGNAQNTKVNTAIPKFSHELLCGAQ
jgi:hypothetical protein